jgi:hypothetical protein
VARGHEHGAPDVWLGLEEEHLGQLGAEVLGGVNLVDWTREERVPECRTARLDQQPGGLAAGALAHDDHLIESGVGSVLIEPPADLAERPAN